MKTNNLIYKALSLVALLCLPGANYGVDAADNRLQQIYHTAQTGKMV